MTPLQDLVCKLDEIAYQLKESNKNLENIASQISDLAEINEHLGTVTIYLSGIDSNLLKLVHSIAPLKEHLG